MTRDQMERIRALCKDSQAYRELLHILETEQGPAADYAIPSVEATQYPPDPLTGLLRSLPDFPVPPAQCAAGTPEEQRTFFTVQWTFAAGPELCYISPALLRWLGYNAEHFAAEGNDFFTLLHPEDRRRYRRELMEVPFLIDGHSMLHRHYRFISSRGESPAMHEFRVFSRAGEHTAPGMTSYLFPVAHTGAAAQDMYTIINEAGEGIWILDAQFLTRDINRAMGTLLGISREQAYSKSIFAILEKESGAHFRAQLDAGGDDWQCREFDFPLTTSGRRPVLCRARCMRRHTAAGETHITLYISSLEEELRLKIQLEKAERNFRAIFNTSHDAVFILHPKTEEILDVNDRACELFGSSRYTLKGIPLQLMAQDSSWESLNIKNSLDDKARIEFETIQYTKSGTALFLIVSATIVSFNNRPAILCVARDITDNKRLQELRASERRFQALLERTGVGVAVFSAGGAFLQTSQALQKMLGYSYTELRQRTLLDLSPPEDYERDTDIFREVMNGRNIGYRAEKRFIRKDGSSLYTVLTLSVLHNHMNQPQVAIGIVEDMSERQQRETELQRKKDLAEEMYSLHSSLLASLNFQVRSPINGILGFATLLEKELTLPEQKDRAQMIYSSAESLMNTIDNLITIARLEANIESLESRCVPAGNETEKVWDYYRPIAENNYVELVLDIRDTRAELYSVAESFRQILGNLLNYTIKFTHHGSIRISVDSAIRNNLPMVYIAIESRTAAINHAMLNGIFSTDFRQSAGLHQNYGGTGLGLIVAKRLIERTAGEIQCEATPEGGVAFHMYFPPVTAPVAAAEEARPPATSMNPEPAVGARLPRILIVEDDQFGQQLVTHYVKGICAADVASSGTKALGMCREYMYDLVLMDINLGQDAMDGVRTLRKMRQIRGYDRTPAIALTAYAVSDEREKYIREGFTDLLPKPFNRKSLLEALNSNLIHKQL